MEPVESRNGSSLDEAKAMEPKETENATEPRWGLLLQPGLAEAVEEALRDLGVCMPEVLAHPRQRGAGPDGYVASIASVASSRRSA